ncbi:pp2c phosphatase 2 C transmembrane domain near N-terminus [Cryptosporidium bovis]|uniref:pp2c phosphatase 2 C transmembrane domain near N-terminus n=1 Tax=Cryptosporidium bovis TaxID=310047 RepID=UPI003519E34D|nr:pp2c phosphatase 2 C transmembrane domain near N-terminus [Cryptosporidium bovis]
MRNIFKNIGNNLFIKKKILYRLCSFINEGNNKSAMATTALLGGGIIAFALSNHNDYIKFRRNTFGKYFRAQCSSKVGSHNSIPSVKTSKYDSSLENNKTRENPFNTTKNVSIIGNQGPISNLILNKHSNSPKISISAIQVNANNPIEDRMIIQRMGIKLCNDKDQEFVLSAVIDGHGGWQVAEYVQKNFVSIFIDELNNTIELLKKNDTNGDISELDIKAAMLYSLRKTYEQLDENLRNILETPYNLGFSKLASVGACVTASIITDDAILTANSGDCLSLYCSEDGMCVPMNEQLSAMNPTEQKRLEEEHIHDKDNLIQCKEIIQGKYLLGLYSLPIYKSCYVKGILQPSRAIGDFRLKHMDFNYNWEKDMSSDKLMNTFSYVLGERNSDNKGDGQPYSYDFINGDDSIALKKDEKRHYVKNPLSFPYVKYEPMLHIYYYNSDKKAILSSKFTDVESISSNKLALTPSYIKNGQKINVEYILPEYKCPNITEYNDSIEFIKDYIYSKWKNASSYFQEKIDGSKKSFLILGTDGVWDFLRPKDVSNILFKSNSVQNGVENIIKNVLQSAGVSDIEKLKSLPKKRKVFDDTSVILIEINK